MKALLLVFAALSVNVATAACLEGSRSLFQEQNGSDRTHNVWRTCVNGSYYPQTTTVGAGCAEGSKLVDYVSNGFTDHQTMVVRTCVNGTYAPISEAKITKCKEGSVVTFLEVDQNDRAHNVTKVCRAGKYVNQN